MLDTGASKITSYFWSWVKIQCINKHNIHNAATPEGTTVHLVRGYSSVQSLLLTLKEMICSLTSVMSAGSLASLHVRMCCVRIMNHVKTLVPVLVLTVSCNSSGDSFPGQAHEGPMQTMCLYRVQEEKSRAGSSQHFLYLWPFGDLLTEHRAKGRQRTKVLMRQSAAEFLVKYIINIYRTLQFSCSRNRTFTEHTIGCIAWKIFIRSKFAKMLQPSTCG